MKNSILFVDDEPNVIQGLKRMLRNMRNDYELYFAGSGKEALTFLTDNHVDIVVTDMRMPEMNGATLLNEIVKKYPNIIRIVLSGNLDQDINLCSAQSAHQFLTKPCDSETLKKTIKRACFIRNIIKNETVLEIITGINKLPSSPSLYNKIIKEIQSPNVSLKKIGDIIVQDITMTARVLQLVNSAFFGLPQKMVNLQHAVNLLGLDILKSVVLYIELFSSFEKSKFLNNQYIKELWKHSMSTGILAKRIAQENSTNQHLIDEAFISGILHDIGKLLLLEVPCFLEQIESIVIQQEHSYLDAEYQVLGTSHAEAGAYLLGLWGLSDNVVEAVAFHHRPYESSRNELCALTAVHIANALLKADCRLDNMGQMSIDYKYLTTLDLVDKIKEWTQICNEVKAKVNVSE